MRTRIISSDNPGRILCRFNSSNTAHQSSNNFAITTRVRVHVRVRDPLPSSEQQIMQHPDQHLVTIRGRGAAENPPNRFEPIEYVPDMDAYDPDEPPPPTQFFRDA